LAQYGPRAREALLRHQSAEHVGDLVLISVVDPGTDEVAAFEELVGCHGGLGGWQTDAVLVHPAQWRLDTDELVGPEAVHRQLVRWRDELGLGPQRDGAGPDGGQSDGALGSATSGTETVERPLGGLPVGG
jgi:hypothetical protein